MKTYPSIPHANHGGIGRKLYTFDKLDGSNIRAEWTKKKRWSKFGSRRRLIDESDLILGPAVPRFMETLSQPLEEIFHNKRWDRVIVFCEYWGAKSFAGVHQEGDPKYVTLLDVNLYKKGILPPGEFLKLFEMHGPRYMGIVSWGVEFLTNVTTGVFPVTFEGVVGKAKGKSSEIDMFKWKTEAWISKVKSLYPTDEANKIIES